MSLADNHNREAGVTLIEILIAVSLLSLLSTGMLVAMRLGFNTMDKTDARLIKNRRTVNSRKIIENEINGFVYSLAEFVPQPNAAQVFPFFQREARSMRFVTSYSLDEAWRGRPRIAAMQVIPGENNQGVRLILNETRYTGPAQAGQNIAAVERDPAGIPVIRFTPILPGPQSFVLADRLAFCRFLYLEPIPQPPFQSWVPEGTQTQRLPMGIRIEMGPLDHATNDLQVTTVTVPLNVNRSPGALYADIP